MSRILLTGASGYIGGVLLNRIKSDLPTAELYALVRTADQAEKVQSLGAHPVQFNFNKDLPQIAQTVIENGVTIVVHTADAMNFGPAQNFIEALSEVKKRTGRPVHFIHTSGAKFFSSHAGVQLPPGEFIRDTQDTYTLQRTFKSPHAVMNQAVNTNISIFDLSESLDVRAYILVPPMVYGPGEGFGNKISIQFVAIVRLAVALQYLPQIPADDETWVLCHLQDLVSLYMTLLKAITASENPPFGKKHGYYFAENGVFSWKALYEGIASRLGSLGYFKGQTAGEIPLVKATEEHIQRASQVLGIPPAYVTVSVAGKCAIRGENGRQLGWEPKFGLEHLMSVVDQEVDFIIKEDKLRPASDK
ncbi:NAD-P-binding protein [Mycena rosella]|uniref:NAD-P-binding protein n=1 Tax=Mycena rosella TaxID=1033263 RepID=A0AAD7GMN7_MYCRO|nr:NAD-P-binding protein [Mycena rosella]